MLREPCDGSTPPLDPDQHETCPPDHHARVRSRLSFLPLLFAVWLGGCASAGNKDFLAFIEPGTTTRRAVTEKLSAPDAEYEHGRIITYWIWETERGYFRPRPATPGQYSLVLVFRSDDVLIKQSLVDVTKER